MIRIVVGTEESQYIPQQVLKYSILKNTDSPVDVHFVQQAANRVGGTNFGFVRFQVPASFGFKGRAIYLDADQLVLGNIVDLWQALEDRYDVALVKDPEGHFGGKSVSRINQSSVMVINCARLRDWDPERLFETVVPNRSSPGPDQILYRDFMTLSWMEQERIQALPPYWNHFNIVDHRTRLTHFSHVRSQPWRTPDHPLTGFWRLWLQEALAAGFITGDELLQEIEQGNVSPAFLDCVAADPQRSCEGRTRLFQRTSANAAVVNDLGIGRTQTRLLGDRLSAEGLDIQFLSKLGLPANPHWKVSWEVNLALHAKLTLIATNEPGERTLYIDGNSILTGRITPFLDGLHDGIHGLTGPIGAADFFVVQGRLEAECARRLLDRDYDVASAYRFPSVGHAADIPPPGTKATACTSVAIARKFSDRPWYSERAPAAGLWTSQLRDALKRDAVQQADLEQDMATGQIRPSALNELLRSDRMHTCDFDRAFVPPEIVPPRERVEHLRRSKFEIPRVPLRKKMKKTHFSSAARKKITSRASKYARRTWKQSRRIIFLLINKTRVARHLSRRVTRKIFPG